LWTSHEKIGAGGRNRDNRQGGCIAEKLNLGAGLLKLEGTSRRKIHLEGGGGGWSVETFVVGVVEGRCC